MRCRAISRTHHCRRLGCTFPPAGGRAPVPQARETSPSSSASGDGSMGGCRPKTTMHGVTPPAW
eukprot:5700887-Pyramimonas_sp.AAC.1